MKALFIVAQDGFRDEEFLEPKGVLEEGGIVVDVASITTETASGSKGMTVRPAIAVKDADIKDYDAIVVIGGPGCPTLADHNEVLDIIAAAHDNDKIIASICIAGTILAKAGVLQGKKATVYSAGEADIIAGGAEYIEEDVVVDGKLVTAPGPAAATAFGKALLKMLVN